MKQLLDTHVLIALSRGQVSSIYPRLEAALLTTGVERFASIASLWEIAIKFRLGKLDVRVAPSDLPAMFAELSIATLPINEQHATADLAVEPDTRDPFDRMLLAQCQVEAMRLVTADRALAGHPLAWRET